MLRPRPLADFVEGCLGAALSRQGFAGSDVIVSWPDIVGARLAAVSQPLKMEWPRKGAASRDGHPEAAAMVVRVEGAFAIEMQHLAPLVLERINAFYGWRCVGRLVLKQGRVNRSGAPRGPDLSLTELERERVARITAPIADADLRAALERLGGAVLATDRREG